mgnify:CR=1 FL=1
MNEKICIYCMGTHGIRLYLYLKKNGIKISFFGDSSPDKCGNIVDGVVCKQYEDILRGEKDIIIIVANAKPDLIIASFKKNGFKKVYTERQAMHLLIKKNITSKSIVDINDVEIVRNELYRPFYIEKSKSSFKNNGNKIIEVNYTDLPGHAFNGFDLMNTLNQMTDFTVKQIVGEKKSKSPNVIPVMDSYIIREYVSFFESEYAISNLLSLAGKMIYDMSVYKQADIVHFQIIHNRFVSLLEYPLLMNNKLCVWTIHDPWILTGDCIHPLECNDWLTGCKKCNDMKIGGNLLCHNESFMWKVKQKILRNINPVIVVSCSFMRNYLNKSPLTKHFNDIYEIPFGVDVNRFKFKNKANSKLKLGIKSNAVTIGFRASNNPIKGCKYIYDALRKLSKLDNVILLAVGEDEIPVYIKKRYRYIEFGWIDNEEYNTFIEACDIFIMPSLAESFGVMAIEAMAAECAVICFENTILKEIVASPECGMAVPYKSSEGIAKIITEWTLKIDEVRRRGILGRERVKKFYTYESYVNKHKILYENILANNLANYRKNR